MLNNLEEILTLDNYSLSNANLLPASSGVYFCVSNKEILYIGSSKNLQERWKAHHKTIELYNFPNVKIYFLLNNNYDKLEKELIKHWNTVLNGKQFNLTKVYENETILNTSLEKSNDCLFSLLLNPEFSGECAKVLLTLLLYLDFDNWILLSQTEMAKEINMQPQNFSRNMKKLEKLNVIQKGKKYRNFYNYRLSPQYAWKGEKDSLKRNLLSNSVNQF